MFRSLAPENLALILLAGGLLFGCKKRDPGECLARCTAQLSTAAADCDEDNPCADVPLDEDTKSNVCIAARAKCTQLAGLEGEKCYRACGAKRQAAEARCSADCEKAVVDCMVEKKQGAVLCLRESLLCHGACSPAAGKIVNDKLSKVPPTSTKTPSHE